MKKIILLGAQGSGKSTQSQLIADTLKIKKLSSSGLLKTVVAQETELGKKIKDLMLEGSLIPDSLMIDLFLEELAKGEYSGGFLLDGFPRNLIQAEALDKKFKIDRVLNLEISDLEAVERISGRRICKNGHVFHIKYNPSQDKDFCDKCGEKLYQREDDKPEAVSRRLKIYRETTTKLLDYYKKQNKLVIFDGSLSISEISKNILSYLRQYAGQENTTRN